VDVHIFNRVLVAAIERGYGEEAQENTMSCS
jgi:hypothetical protein